MRQPRVYVAGPMTGSGDRSYNFYKGVVTGHKLMKAGFAPFIPHMSFIQGAFHHTEYEAWLEYDFTWIEVCDAIFRIPGKSPGAAREVKFARQRHIPIFTSLRSIKKWKKNEFNTPSSIGLSNKGMDPDTSEGLLEATFNKLERIPRKKAGSK